jgi:hypothetical protein
MSLKEVRKNELASTEMTKATRITTTVNSSLSVDWRTHCGALTRLHYAVTIYGYPGDKDALLELTY